MYGNQSCTPNMHLHLHFKEYLLDYGPAHSFWCFSFERYNGILGSYQTNRKSIEVQILRKFVRKQTLQSATVHADNQLLSLLLPTQGQSSSTSITNLCTGSEDTLTSLNMSCSSLDSIQSFDNNGVISLLPPLHHNVFSSDN